MNICDKLPFYLYDEMSGQEKKEFEGHLHTCGECANSVKVFAAVKESARLTSAPLQTINEILEKTTRKKSFSFAAAARKWKLPAAFAASLLIGICVFSLKQFVPGSSNVYYYSDASIEEIENIDYCLDEIETENYFL